MLYMTLFSWQICLTPGMLQLHEPAPSVGKIGSDIRRITAVNPFDGAVRSWPRMGMTLLQDENFSNLSLILRR
jgi:hypothetical protein